MKKIYFLLALVIGATTAQAQLVLNEVLYDPSNSSLDGDANGDGVYSQEDDSFLEIYNSSNTNFDISGYEIWDSTISSGVTQQRYVIPSGTLIPPMGVLVIFGGGVPVGNFGGAVVLSADTAASGFSLNNSGEYINVKDTGGSIVLMYDTDALSNNPNESYTRNPDITGTFEQHEDNTSLKFSPGTRINGTSFDTNIVVTSLSIQGMNGVDSITTQAGTLQMVSTALPASAADQSVSWVEVRSLGAPALVSIDSNGLVTALRNGTAIILATSNDALGTTAQTQIFITNQSTGLNKITNEAKFKVYPNPAVDYLKLDTQENIELVEVFTMEGKLLKTFDSPNAELNIQELNSGSYLLRIKLANEVVSSRFIKK